MEIKKYTQTNKSPQDPPSLFELIEFLTRIFKQYHNIGNEKYVLPSNVTTVVAHANTMYHF